MNSLDMNSSDCIGRGMRELIDRHFRQGARDFVLSRENWQLLYTLERSSAGVTVVAENDRAILLLPAFGEWVRVTATHDMGGTELRWERNL